MVLTNFFFKTFLRYGLHWLLNKNKNLFSNRYCKFLRFQFLFLNIPILVRNLFFMFFFFKFLEKKKLETTYTFKNILKSRKNKKFNSFFFHKSLYLYYYHVKNTFTQSLIFLITTKENLYHYIYLSAKELNQPGYSFRWLPGVLSNFRQTTLDIIRFGLLDQRLLYRVPDSIFLFGSDFKVFNEIKRFKRPVFGLVDAAFPVKALDFAFVVNDRSFLGMYFLFNIIKRWLVNLYSY